jgi:ATP-dependent DNA helicase RecQ
LEQVILFLNQKEICRSKFLVNYFNQTSENCGICDICKETNQSKINEQDLEKMVLNLLIEAKEISEIYSILNLDENIIKQMLQKLIQSEHILEINGKLIIRKN